MVGGGWEEVWVGYVAAYVLGMVSLYLFARFVWPPPPPSSPPSSLGLHARLARAPLGYDLPPSSLLPPATTPAPVVVPGMHHPPPPSPPHPSPSSSSSSSSSSASRRRRTKTTKGGASTTGDSPLKVSRKASTTGRDETDKEEAEEEEEEKSSRRRSSGDKGDQKVMKKMKAKKAKTSKLMGSTNSRDASSADNEGPEDEEAGSDAVEAMDGGADDGHHSQRRRSSSCSRGSGRTSKSSKKQSQQGDGAQASSSSSSPSPSSALGDVKTEGDQLRALRAEVQSLKQSLSAIPTPAASSMSPMLNSGSGSLKLTRTPALAVYGPADIFMTTLPIYKQGWLELRTFKVFNRRYFVLHGNWLTYFKDEKMRRSDCYGHIRLNSSCEAKELSNKERSFILRSTSKESLFRMRGPGVNAATTHRMMHAARSKAIMRADLQNLTSEWVASIQFVCQLLNSQYQSQNFIDRASDPTNWSGPSDDDSSATNTEFSFKQSRGTTSASGILAHLGQVQLINESESGWQKHTNSGTSTDPCGKRSLSAGREEVTTHKIRRSNCEGEAYESNDDSQTEESDDSSSTDEENASSNGSDSEHEVQNIEETEFDYQWPQEQAATVEALKADLGEKYREENCDRFMLWRFLKARAFDVSLARQMLDDYFAWRREYRPQEIQASEVSDEIALGKAFFIGYDLQRRPILVCLPGRHDPKGFGMSNFDSSMAKTASHMLQSYYPERLGVLVAVNSGMMINVVWRIVKSLLDERTRNKINFLKGTKELLRLGIFDPNTLPVQYGGNAYCTIAPGSYGLEYLTQG